MSKMPSSVNIPFLMIFIGGLGNQLYYNQSFLKGTSCNSETFLKEISYQVNLTDLYQVVGTCYYNAQMEFCPILIQIKHHILRRDYGCNYLLQVWNKDGQKVFQRGLQQQLNLWSISNEYFIYKPMDGDEDSDCFHITNLKKENSTLLVPDTINDSTCKEMVYNDGVLYISNQTKIFLIECRDRMGKGEKHRIMKDQLKIQVIKPGLPIHAIFNFKKAINMYFSKFMVIVAMETSDNQIDFSALEIQNMGRDTFSYQFKQQREVVNREVRIDKISKFVLIIDRQNTLYAIAQRDSGKFDLYWDMTLVDTSEQTTVFDVSISFDTLYFWLPNGNIKCISTAAQSQINFHQAEDVFKGFEFDIIFYQNIKNNFNIYNSFTLIRTTLYVVHGAYVSLFNIQDQVWIRHIQFEEGDVIRLVKKWQKTAKGEDKLELAALIKTGSIYNNVLSLIENQSNMETIGINSRTFQVPGRVLKSYNDNQDYMWLYVMVKDLEDKVRIFVLHLDQLYEVTDNFDTQIDEYTQIVPLFDRSDARILTQKHNHIVLYEQSIGKPELADDQDMENFLTSMQDTVIFRKIYDLNLPIQGSIHSCISMNSDDHLFLTDNHNFYKYNVATKTHKTYPQHNCVGLYVIDEQYCYTLSHSSTERGSGIRLYDMNNILNKKSDMSYKLANAQVGASTHMDWNNEYSRLSFLQSFDRLNIVPALHRNTIAFIGMANRKDYLATKVIKDKFIALDSKNHLFCWSCVTGKLLQVNRLPNNQDYSNFVIYQSPKETSEDSEYKREWFLKILLMKKQPENFYDQSQMETNDGSISSTKHQQTFAQQQKRELREFKLIEIINEEDVKEHISFLHSYYPHENQKILFDVNTNFMLEKLTYPRVFLYEKIVTDKGNMVQWRLLRRFNKYPTDLESDQGPMKVLSPCFSYFVDLDRGTNQLVIRDTFTQQELYKISKDLMDPLKTPSAILMNRFKWVDQDTIIVMNDEGVEKKIDVKDNFKEIEFNIIPLYNDKEVQEPASNFFTNRPELEVSQVLERLKRKYQRYKTAYYLEHRREPFSLYTELFTVDYQIDKCSGMHTADMSFTFLHWRLIEQLDQKKILIDDIDDNQIEILCYNILPEGDTILHELCSNGQIIKKIFETAHPNEENIAESKFHIPFIQNLSHMSPMHLAMQAQDIRIMDTFLKYLAAYGLDHHSRALTEMIPFMIEKGLPSLLPYLDSRLQQTNQVREIKKGCLKKNSIGVTELSPWFKQEDFNSKLMATSRKDNDTLIERPIKVEFVDIPRIFHYSENKLSDEFFLTLAETDSFDIFEKKVIQKLIEFNYPIVKYWTIKKLFIPFMMFQATLFIYLNFIFQQEHYLLKQLDFPMQIALGVFSWYFLQNEFTQLRDDGWNWFHSVWNYIDVITPCTISYVIVVNAFEIPIHPNTERTIQAIGVFFMWFKFLQFFRIFKSYGYLIRLIIVVITDMSTFMVVLFITIVAFSDTFLTLSNGNEEHDKFVFSFTDSIIYVYRIILGDFDVSQFGQVAVPLCYALFILCTIFNTIVMLNLLIAIISESFSFVKENSSNAAYQEMAGMIAENNYIIPQKVKDTYAELNKYIVVVTDLEAEVEKEDEESVKRIDQLKKHVMQKIDVLGKDMKDLKQGQTKQHDYLDKQEKQNNKILMMLQMMQGMNNAGGGGGVNGSVLGGGDTNNYLSQSIAMNFRTSMKRQTMDKDFESSRRLETESAK